MNLEGGVYCLDVFLSSHLMFKCSRCSFSCFMVSRFNCFQLMEPIKSEGEFASLEHYEFVVFGTLPLFVRTKFSILSMGIELSDPSCIL